MNARLTVPEGTTYESPNGIYRRKGWGGEIMMKRITKWKGAHNFRHLGGRPETGWELVGIDVIIGRGVRTTRFRKVAANPDFIRDAFTLWLDIYDNRGCISKPATG